MHVKLVLNTLISSVLNRCKTRLKFIYFITFSFGFLLLLIKCNWMVQNLKVFPFLYSVMVWTGASPELTCTVILSADNVVTQFTLLCSVVFFLVLFSPVTVEL